LLEVSDLSISSRLGDRERPITVGVSLQLGAGETLGIVGESGSGKSLTARAVTGLLPTGLVATGSVRFKGRELLTLNDREMTKVRGRGIAMIFQDPFTMLNPLVRCGEQIVELLRDDRGRRLDRRARRNEARARLAEVGILDSAVVDAYPFQLSGGMRQRVGIAAALALDPELVIADEPSTALDVTTQREILARLRELQESRGMGMILITHDLRVAFSMSDRIEVLYAGSVLERSPADAMDREPRHPYTLGLLLSEPPGDRRIEVLHAIPGSVPGPDEVAGRCAFADRCSWKLSVCEKGAPRLVESEPGRESACVRIEEISAELIEVRRAAASEGDPGADPSSRSTRTDLTRPGESVRQPRDAQVDSDPSQLVVVNGLAKTFKSRTGRTVQALRDVSITVGRGESVGVVGESGSGKTTLGRCLLGLERPDAGSIVLDGLDVSDVRSLTASERTQYRKTIQMVFQDPYSTLNPVRTVGATLVEAVTLSGSGSRAGGASRADTKRAVDELLDLVGLPRDYARRKPVALSGGERQRVGVARALAARPKLIVCDEPVSALDVSVQAQILNLLASIHRELGVSYLFITHDLAVVRQVTDRCYVLQRGELVEHGATEKILDQPENPYTKSLVASIPTSRRSWLEGAIEV
jgi:peptide/nickel transport system ATP-binding protein